MHVTTIKLHPKLPIFRLEHKNQVCLYTPGHTHHVTPEIADVLQNSFNNIESENHISNQLAFLLIKQAKQAQQAWNELSNISFSPICLTVYLSNHCNLACGYCFAAPARISNYDQPIINEETVVQAATIVAKNCVQKGVAFTLVLHGGGEPTLHWKLLKQLVFITQQIATNHQIDWWGYIATNGMISERKAEWLAKNFNLIGLSCDGPPMIQNAQRPTTRGNNTAKFVERTANILVKNTASFVVRATITPYTIKHQSDIVNYFYAQLGAKTIRFEPTYFAKDDNIPEFIAKDAELFVSNFIAAQQLANTLGCELSLSTVRPNEIHGPYCNILRDVLHIIPDGSITGCFLSVSKNYAIGKLTSLESIHLHANQIVIDENHIAKMRSKVTQIPMLCQQCINVFHCTHGCPNSCLAIQKPNKILGSQGFYCHVYKKLTELFIFSPFSCKIIK